MTSRSKEGIFKLKLVAFPSHLITHTSTSCSLQVTPIAKPSLVTKALSTYEWHHAMTLEIKALI